VIIEQMTHFFPEF